MDEICYLCGSRTNLVGMNTAKLEAPVKGVEGARMSRLWVVEKKSPVPRSWQSPDALYLIH